MPEYAELCHSGLGCLSWRPLSFQASGAGQSGDNWYLMHFRSLMPTGNPRMRGTQLIEPAISETDGARKTAKTTAHTAASIGPAGPPKDSAGRFFFSGPRLQWSIARKRAILLAKGGWLLKRHPTGRGSTTKANPQRGLCAGPSRSVGAKETAPARGEALRPSCWGYADLFGDRHNSITHQLETRSNTV
jgi:hypothetical protein